ncbi:MAG: hypothetical protein IJS14_02245 [Lentisphaeria bacterium]|nr:hypothetical protein [Lentisphaeria bacterium]
MVLLLVGFAVLGLMCVVANLLEVIGQIVVGFMKYIVGPVLLLLLIMGFIAWASGGRF